jgi:glutamate racemase
MKDIPTIGVFDSGVGGLSVVRALRSELPGADVLYVADSAHVPYGGREAAFVRERSHRITEHLIAEGADAVVVACNTATAAAVDSLRAALDLPIVAMEPAVKPAARLSRTGVIGVLATAGTLGSERYSSLLDRHGRHVEVLERVCHHWVTQVESGCLEGEEVRRLVTAEVEPLVSAGADALVLGCTHFPFLADRIGEAAGPGITLVDPAPAVARQLARCLAGVAGSPAGWGEGRLRVRTTGDRQAVAGFLRRIGMEAEQVEAVGIY